VYKDRLLCNVMYEFNKVQMHVSNDVHFLYKVSLSTFFIKGAQSNPPPPIPTQKSVKVNYLE